MYKNKNNGIDKKDSKKSFSSFITVDLDYKNNKNILMDKIIKFYFVLHIY